LTQSWLDRLAALHPPDGIIANSGYTADTAELQYPSVPKAVVYCPVASPDPMLAASRETTRRGLGVNDGESLLFHAARFEAWKGLLVVVDALTTLRELPNWRLFIAGAPQRPTEVEFAGKVRADVAGKGLNEHVVFLGHRADVPRLMA